jgi:sec-independent protein translocase protein TatA
MVCPTLAFLPSGSQWIFIAILGLLLFGRRLPEVGRSLGKGIVEFKKGLKDVGEDIEMVDDSSHRGTLPGPEQYAAQPKQAAPQFRFDPYTGKPLDASGTASSESQKVG